jgi:hypothetical protein
MGRASSEALPFLGAYLKLTKGLWIVLESLVIVVTKA